MQEKEQMQDKEQMQEKAQMQDKQQKQDKQQIQNDQIKNDYILEKEKMLKDQFTRERSDAREGTAECQWREQERSGRAGDITCGSVSSPLTQESVATLHSLVLPTGTHIYSSNVIF